jgi:arabinogalactan oligomer/maltooligosaccharide transport system permease protein
MEQQKRNLPGFVRFLISVGKFILDILLRIVFTFRDLGIAIWHGIRGIGRMFVKLVKRFIDGSLWTKLSHLVMGIGNFARGQIGKGIVFLLIEVLFIVYMIASPTLNGVPAGAKAIGNFFSLGHDHGMQVSREDISDNITQIQGVENEIDLTDKSNNLAEINLSIRTINLISKYLQGADDTFVVENNNNAIYTDKTIGKVIKDYRYGGVELKGGHRDYELYGLSEYDIDHEITLKTGTTILLMISNTPHENFEGALTFEGASTSALSVYRYTSDDFKGEYVYLILASVKQASYTNPVIAKMNSTYSGTEIYRISAISEQFTADVDNSFLMMLFGIISFAIIAVFLVAWNLAIASSYKTDKDIREGVKPTTFLEDLKTLLDGRFHIALLTPAVLLLTIFTIIPTILMILIAFTDMSEATMISGQRLVSWTGFANFSALFSQSGGTKVATEVGKNFLGVLGWTLLWAIIATFSCYFGGIFLALLLNRKDVKMKKMWRTIFILTIAIPQFITFLILRNMLTASGPINTMLGTKTDFLQLGSGQLTGIAAQDAGRIWLARATVLIINLYVGIPYTMLMTSGILMNIPADLYEAATIDGANKFQMFRKITLPYIIFVTTPYLISSFIGNITSFNTIFLTTQGGPAVEGSIAGKTDLLVTWLYKMTIDESIYNAGSIIGILTFCITAFITLIAYRNSKAYKEEDTFQ